MLSLVAREQRVPRTHPLRRIKELADGVDLRVEPATGYAERVGALAMLDESLPNQDGVTLGADAGHDTSDFVAACRERGITPHVAQTRDTRRRSAVNGRTTRHDG